LCKFVFDKVYNHVFFFFFIKVRDQFYRKSVRRSLVHWQYTGKTPI